MTPGYDWTAEGGRQTATTTTYHESGAITLESAKIHTTFDLDRYDLEAIENDADFAYLMIL